MATEANFLCSGYVLSRLPMAGFNPIIYGRFWVITEAVESISSDGDKRRLPSDILKKDAGSADTLFGVTRAARHISSDGDKAEVLIEMAGSYRDNGGLGMAYFEAVKSISSDGDHARVLSTLLAEHGDDRTQWLEYSGRPGNFFRRRQSRRA